MGQFISDLSLLPFSNFLFIIFGRKRTSNRIQETRLMTGKNERLIAKI